MISTQLAQLGGLGSESLPLILGTLLLVLVLFGVLLTFAKRYKRCPSNKVLVVYGRTSSGRTAQTLHGGGKLVWPLIQSYEYLSLDPMQIEIPLEGALSVENIRVAVPSVFTVAIGTEQEIMSNAAIRLLGLTHAEIVKQAEDIIFGQLRQVIASMRIEEINRDRDVFLSSIQSSLEPELKKIGLVLINVNIKDITDESGYIEAIGRKAASEAVQQAIVDVADQERIGAIGVAGAERQKAVEVAQAEKLRDIGTKEAERDRAVRVAELERDKAIGEQTFSYQREAQVKDREREMRVAVAEANAMAVAGENEAKATIAKTNAELRVREAEAYQVAETKHREAEAAVREAQFYAEAKAAEAEAKKIEAEKRAELEAVSLAEKAQTIVDAEATAERRRIEAEGEAKAIFARLQAEANGEYEILTKKAAGLKAIVEGCGGSQAAFQMLLLEHIDKLSETAATAISNVKFDKVIVWDTGTGEGGNGGAAGFLKNLAGGLPPMLQMMRDIGGVEMPEYFGKILSSVEPKAEDSGSAEPAEQDDAELVPAAVGGTELVEAPDPEAADEDSSPA